LVLKGKASGVMKKHNFDGQVRRTVRRRIAAMARRQSFHSGPHLEEHGHAGHLGDERSLCRTASDASARGRESNFDQWRSSRL